MSDTHTPLWKQCLGAVVGAAAALVLYGGFVLVMDQMPNLGAIVVSQPKEQAVTTSSAPSTVQDIVQRARQIAAQNLQEAQQQQEVAGGAVVAESEVVVTAVPVKLDRPVAVVASSSSSAAAVAKTVVLEARHAGAPTVTAKKTSDQLPSSGLDLWMGAAVAFAGASAVHRKAVAGHVRRLFS